MRSLKVTVWQTTSVPMAAFLPARPAPRRLTAAAAVAMLIAVAFCTRANAQPYQGATAGWAGLSLAVGGGQLTAFTTSTGRVPCTGTGTGQDVDPVKVAMPVGGAVAVEAGRFHLAGQSTTDHGAAAEWTVDGAMSLDQREVTGTLTIDTTNVSGAACHGTFDLDAIVAPRATTTPRNATFTPAAPTTAGYNPLVSFDYKNGAVTHLSAGLSVLCADTSVLGARLDTTAYRMDPIRPSRDGRFRIQGGVLDDYKVVNHFVITGRIVGRTATGTIDASRELDVNGVVSKCTRHIRWRATAVRPAAAAAPPVFFNVVPFRFGAPSAWRYYLIVKVTACSHARRARVSVVGGPSQTVACGKSARLGPLAPQRTYRVRVSARGGRSAPVVPVYLPGEDGDWVRLN
jgi:hypothetical protein